MIREWPYNVIESRDQTISELRAALAAKEQENAELRRGGEFAVSKANEYSQLADDWRRRAEAAELRAEALATALEGIVNGNWTADYMRSRAWSALDAHRAEAPKTDDAPAGGT